MFRKITALLIPLAFFLLPCLPQHSDTSSLTLVFGGDIMGHDEQIKGAWDEATQSYNYEPTFRYIKPFIEEADIAIGNLEVTLAGPAYTGYPQFSSPDELAKAASKAGFDVMIQANNHALDRGKKGFERTLRALDTLNLIHTGTFRNTEDREKNYPLILEKNNIRIALLNYTYGTNGLEIALPCIINRIDTVTIKNDLEKAGLANPDFVIVTMHWGEEYQRSENRQQRQLASFLFRHGADAIIGSHPHVIQPVRKHYPDPIDSSRYNLVVYSLGNFVSNQRAQYKDGGIMFSMHLIKTRDGTSVSDYNYMPYWVYRADLTGKSTFYVLPVDLYSQNEDHFNLLDHNQYKITRFYEDTRQHLKGIPESPFFRGWKIKEGVPVFSE
ncbi:MAG: CapA family protein [Bacteroidales bacterium]|nr:CapA family protein [Bacteroidales bacterium]